MSLSMQSAYLMKPRLKILPISIFYALLASAGIPTEWQSLLFYGSVTMDALFGWACLFNVAWRWQLLLVLSMVLYLFVGACWLSVVCLQLKMRDMAQIAARDQTPLPERYWRFERIWTILGFPAFISSMVIYWLMVSKPF